MQRTSSRRRRAGNEGDDGHGDRGKPRGDRATDQGKAIPATNAALTPWKNALRMAVSPLSGVALGFVTRSATNLLE